MPIELISVLIIGETSAICQSGRVKPRGCNGFLGETKEGAEVRTVRLAASGHYRFQFSLQKGVPESP
ncbi:MAG: hypothetical protein MK186_12890, partial [Henriciella sp.]|nr:hypothetical protein [Henriciella sp.]